MPVEELRNNHGAARRDSVLVVMRHRIAQSGLVIEVVVRGQIVRLVRFPQRAMQGVRSALQHLIQRAAAGMSKGRIRIERLHSHFLHRVLGRAVGQATVPGGIGRPVDQNFVGLRSRSADAPAGRAAAVERMDQGWLAGSQNPDRKRRQHQRGPSVQGQVLHFFGGDGLSHGGVLGIHQGRVRCD